MCAYHSVWRAVCGSPQLKSSGIHRLSSKEAARLIRVQANSSKGEASKITDPKFFTFELFSFEIFCRHSGCNYILLKKSLIRESEKLPTSILSKTPKSQAVICSSIC